MPPPRPPTGRLAGLRQPPRKRQAGGQQTKPADPKPKKCCDKPNPITDEEGATICKTCFTQISNVNIVADTEFAENQGGRSTVIGGTVGDNSRHAKSLGPGAYRKIGGGERNTLADIQNAGHRAMKAICPKLSIEENVMIQAESVWTLAANINFSAGRRTDEVVAACLFTACRRQKNNHILLIDIAEHLKINVFRLGEVYKDMCKELYLSGESVGHQYLQELEPLIKKYCDKLQFGPKTKDVAQDALKIIRRMNRDWLVDGRHPAGLCGACIILAARMNNFQRSVREVVYVSKVADVTIAKRVEEFRRTRSAGLTVDEFRLYANRIKHQHDPPALYAQKERLEKLENRKRKREDYRQSVARDSQARESQQPVEIPDDVTNASSSRQSSVDAGTSIPDNDQGEEQERAKRQRTDDPASLPTPPTTQGPSQSSSPVSAAGSSPQQQMTGAGKRKITEPDSSNQQANKRQCTEEPQAETRAQLPPRYDADGFAIPALPAQTTPATEEPPPTEKRGRGRPKKVAPPPIVITEEELAAEDYLEEEIEEALRNGEVQESQTEVEKKKEEERIEAQYAIAKKVADDQRQRERENKGPAYMMPLPEDVYPTAQELEDEFADDPEVQNCLLGAEEVRTKEQIWVTHNEDWLRKQAEKEMLAKVAKATGSQGKGTKRGKGDKAGKKKRSKMGDGAVLTESSTPIETPADAAKAMLEKRAPRKSQFVDFSALQRIYGRETPSRASSTSPEGSGENTRAPTDAGSESAVEGAVEDSVPGNDGEEGEEDDDMDDEDDSQAGGFDSLSIPVEPATWENLEDDPEDEEEEEEPNLDDAWKQGLRRTDADGGVEADEFGELGGDDFDVEDGEDYDGYDD